MKIQGPPLERSGPNQLRAPARIVRVKNDLDTAHSKGNIRSSIPEQPASRPIKVGSAPNPRRPISALCSRRSRTKPLARKSASILSNVLSNCRLIRSAVRKFGTSTSSRDPFPLNEIVEPSRVISSRAVTSRKSAILVFRGIAGPDLHHSLDHPLGVIRLRTHCARNG